MKPNTNRPDFRSDKVWDTLNHIVSLFFISCDSEGLELDEELVRKMVRLATIIEDEIEMDETLYIERAEVLKKVASALKRKRKTPSRRSKTSTKKRV